jgi:hypothetical protein
MSWRLNLKIFFDWRYFVQMSHSKYYYLWEEEPSFCITQLPSWRRWT